MFSTYAEVIRGYRRVATGLAIENVHMIMHDLSGLGPKLVDRNPIHSEKDIIEITV